MIERLPNHYGDESCSSCVVAGDYIFLAHHGGGQDHADAAYQLRAALDSMRHTLAKVSASLDDVVQLHLYLKELSDFRRLADVITEYFPQGVPARTTTTTEFLGDKCLCQVDAVAYKKR